MRSCSTILYYLKSLIIITLLVTLPIAFSVKCFSSLQKNQAEECGPNGYCFLFNGSDLITYKKTIRGCDNSFVCEVMVNNITKEKYYPVGEIVHDTLNKMYCAKNIAIRPTQEEQEMYGTLCCCDHDWCNVNYKNEPANDLDRIFELDRGTMQDYLLLKKIAQKYGIS
ncbi:hypothetical protein ACH3XW_7380 [Acanthocheilonema viteae]